MSRKGLARLTFLHAALLLILVQGCQSSPAAKAAPASQIEFLFCHWSVENFFDDQNDGRDGDD
jgi:hypothetical protein